jgi:AraC-like DNA-binding protein
MGKLKNQNLKYLVASNDDDLWGLYVTTIGFQSIKPNINYPPKEHPSSYWFNSNRGRILHEYQLLYVINGEGIFESKNCKPTKVNAGSIICLYPEEWHTYRPSKQVGWDEYWVGFNGVSMHRLRENHFFSPHLPVLNIGFNEQIVGLFKQGISIAEMQKTAYQQVLAGVVNLMLGFIFYAEKNNSFRDKELVQWIDKARVMMTDNDDNNLSPKDIAKSLNISYSWFRRIFKQYTGFSPAQYQMEIRLQKSKELLTSTTMAIKEISYDLNFESTSYFVTFFKSKTGLSPTEYRTKVHGKVEKDF